MIADAGAICIAISNRHPFTFKIYTLGELRVLREGKLVIPSRGKTPGTRLALLKRKRDVRHHSNGATVGDEVSVWDLDGTYLPTLKQAVDHRDA